MIDQCRQSVSRRQSLARTINVWLHSGSNNGSEAIYNKLGTHCDKLASALFSPANLTFRAEYENDYGPEYLKRAEVAGRYMTREFARRDLDIEFQEGLEQALPHGCVIIKSLWGHDGIDARTIMPWQFGVYREDEPSIDHQEALCETTYLTEEQLWRRISHRSDAKDLFRRAREHARAHSGDDITPGIIYQVALAGAPPLIQDQGASAQAGGLVNFGSQPLSSQMPAEVAAGLIQAHELWVVNDETGDYTTIQIIDPDIMIAPRLLRSNLFFPHDHPFSLIRPNPHPAYFFGKSELHGLLKLQALVRDRTEDIKKIMSLQYSRIRAFVGFSGMNDERFDKMHDEGWIAEETPGAKVDDLTPPLPPNAFEELKMILQFFDDIAGYDNVMSGKGESNIRSGNHFQGALRQASPRLRDRAIRSERQLAGFGEKNMWLIGAKDPRTHWLKVDDKGESDFSIADLPDDTRMLVDSHSASPVFEQDHANMAAFLFKSGAIDGEDLIDMLPVPNRDQLKEKLRAREISKRQLLQKLPPDVLAKTLAPHGGKH